MMARGWWRLTVQAEATVDEATCGLLAGYDPGERFAILEHKYFLGIEMGFDPGVQCAVTSWEAGYAVQWRQERQQADCRAQMAEIEGHRRYLSRLGGREVSGETAARHWIAHYAAGWRAQRDRQILV